MFHPRGRISTKPSPYPLFPYRFLRTAQLLSALITSSILSYFIWHLRNEHYPVPWTFIFLLSASVFTLPLLALSTYLHHTSPYTLPKRSLFFFNLPLTLLWLLGLALLTWNLSYMLGHQCTIERWHNNAGMMVCRMYKALTAFAVTGAASTVGAAVLDWRTWRGEGGLGVGGRGGYGMMEIPSSSATSGGRDAKEASSSSGTAMGTTTTDGTELREGVRPGALWDGDQSGLKRPWTAIRTLEAKDFGYAVPEGQTTYGGERGPSMDICER